METLLAEEDCSDLLPHQDSNQSFMFANFASTACKDARTQYVTRLWSLLSLAYHTDISAGTVSRKQLRGVRYSIMMTK